MSYPIRFVVTLIAGLALLCAVAWLIVVDTTRAWFERDLALRSGLAVYGAHRWLAEELEQDDDIALSAMLADIVNDERILGALVCDSRFVTVAATAEAPPGLTCSEVAARLREHGETTDEPPSWHLTTETAGGDVHVSAVPLTSKGLVLGYAVLLHDLSYIARREDSTQRFLFFAFLVLSTLTALVTLVAVRVLFRGWSQALRQMALGEAQDRPPEFVPLLRDMRGLLDRLAREERGEVDGGGWNPQRLKLTLQRHLHGERIVVLANREPYVHERRADGTMAVLHPASGLVSALEPVMRACSGVWIAHGSGSGDRDVVDSNDRVMVPPDEQSYSLRRIWLTREEEKGYYYGFANEGLWPLCHVAHARPIFRTEDWNQYTRVNHLFADAVCEEVDTDDPVILVQDYHFALVPGLLRRRLPRATILTFWHIPWPNAEQIGICPWHVELVQGLLGSSILGFHTQQHCNNFLEAADRFLEARLDREDFAVIQNLRRTLVRPYPISVEWPHRWAQTVAAPAECRAEVFRELGLRSDARLAVGVDRLDYTKGIEERLRAVERLLEREPEWQGRFSFLQVASPSRTEIERYDQLRRDVEALTERINGRFARDGWKPIELRYQHTEPAEVFRLYRAADLCYVSSLHDGMNLVAKEYLVAREDELGVLVLSEFTGAARELAAALLVNPYDIDQAAAALSLALRMPVEEQRARMRAMRRIVSEFNVYRWAGRMLLDASRLRQEEQLAGLIAGREAAPTDPARTRPDAASDAA
ncbi:MAG TPA: trehalose-6-phosphate synthase [Candidatus Binatia bacterium]|nr:trehalose-6-phosphate synthase [Candidatus Binatia bacterium]